jgi:cysteine desulfurase
LARLINSRYYFDYNSTSPLADAVKNAFVKGDVFFANPSSPHTSGKKAAAAVRQTTEYLYKLFNLPQERFKIVFHSGATEGANTLILGAARYYFAQGKSIHFFFSSTDHQCVLSLKGSLEEMNHTVSEFGVDESGVFDESELIAEMKASNKDMVFLNYTYVNNETGVVWNLEKASRIKQATGALVHVDAVQSVGKISDWDNLQADLDCYTYSGHKFGSMKGVGFSFFRADYNYLPLLLGGGQQNNFRPGTLNAFGIYSLQLAFEELKDKQNIENLEQAKQFIEDQIKSKLGDECRVVGEGAVRNANTICMTFKLKKVSDLIIKFDTADMDVGSGSACSSGVNQPSKVLLSYGIPEREASNIIRLSFGPYLSQEDAKEVVKKILDVL